MSSYIRRCDCQRRGKTRSKKPQGKPRGILEGQAPALTGLRKNRAGEDAAPEMQESRSKLRGMDPTGIEKDGSVCAGGDIQFEKVGLGSRRL